MKLEELEVYRISMDLGDSIWDVARKWGFFEKDTIGKQLVRAADSISANLSEGFGRYHFKENRQFGYYSRGSLYETQTWLKKAFKRKLISKNNFEMFQSKINLLGRKLNAYIKSIGNSTLANNQ